MEEREKWDEESNSYVPVMYGWRLFPSVGLNGSLAKALNVFRDHGGSLFPSLCPSLSLFISLSVLLSVLLSAYVNDMTAGLCHETISLSSYRRLCAAADSCNRLPSCGASETHVLSNTDSFSLHAVHIDRVLLLTHVEFRPTRPVAPLILCSLFIY